jgi:hypothetical protein
VTQPRGDRQDRRTPSWSEGRCGAFAGRLVISIVDDYNTKEDEHEH